MFDANTLGEMQTRFWTICKEKLGGRLPESFMEWLNGTDFFTAPASTRYHGAYEGGLLAHSLTVYDRLNNMIQIGDATEGVGEDSIAMTALFHDLCKTGCYQPSTRSVKQPDGSWKQMPSYNFKTDFPMGHGEKSVYLLAAHGVKLTEEEALAIRWHMGGFDNAVKGGCRDMNEALSVSPLVLALQMADMTATYWDGD